MTAILFFLWETVRRASLLFSKAGPVAMIAFVLSLYTTVTSSFGLMDVLTEPIYERLLEMKGAINTFLATYADNQSFNAFGYCMALDKLSECIVALYQMTIGWFTNLFLFFSQLFISAILSLSIGMGWKYVRKMLFP